MQLAGMRNAGSTGAQPQAAPDMAGLMALLGPGNQGGSAAGDQGAAAMPAIASLFGGTGAAARPPGAFDPTSLLNALATVRGINPEQQGQPDLTNMMAMFGGGVAPVEPVANPEELYNAQLQQLSDMGFFDREKNIQALQACGGNVHAAVERLLA
jgi:hypothetical protein